MGSLITFSQYFLISFIGLFKFLEFVPYPRLKPRRIPITAYLVQVFLFYIISVLNNAAFAYKIPMPVHIIFRSGGLVVSMLMGWILLGRRLSPSHTYPVVEESNRTKFRYQRGQVLAVFLVTVGILLTTVSASKPSSSNHKGAANSAGHTRDYAMGIFLLTLALFLGAFLGIAQDRMYAKYGRTQSKPASEASSRSKEPQSDIQPWQESMFYLHFLGMPMFFSMRHDLTSTILSTRFGPQTQIILPHALQRLLHSGFLPFNNLVTDDRVFLQFPSVYLPLFLNAFTQLVCVAGVHRLASRISSLAVTLTLVVRKALSMVISVVLFGDQLSMDWAHKVMLWAGACLVFAGTILYTTTSTKKFTPPMKDKKED